MAPHTHEALLRMRDMQMTLPSLLEENPDVREELLAESRKLLLSLERPENVVARICFQLWETLTCQIAIDLGLFDILEQCPGPCLTAELAKKTEGDPSLLGRILRCLASYGAVDEVDVDTYASNTVSHTFPIDVNKTAMEGCLQFLPPGWFKAPAFLKHNGYQNPTDPFKSIFAMAHDKPEGAPLWEIIMATPHERPMNVYMSNFNEGHRVWSDFYPVEDRLGKGADTDANAVMMVDVGGGLGHQAAGLRKKFPQLPGRFVVQDLNALPPDSDRVAGVEYEVHDFMKEQPIKGARLYYLRYVPHDWPQKTNIEILTHLRKAMKPGYSRLIVNEWILTARGASAFMTAQDMNMMSVGGGMERTEAQHREYIDGAGLKISGIYSPGDRISESVIEAEVA